MSHRVLILSFSLFLASVFGRVNAYDAVIDGIYYNLDKDNSTAAVAARSKSTANKNAYSGYVTVPRFVEADGVVYEVTAVDEFAFYYCAEVVGVTLPETITSVGKSAFGSCTNLSTINLPDPLSQIGEYAFNNCGKLRRIKLPEGLKNIPGFAFAGCTSLLTVTIPDNIETIAAYAFSYCDSLREVWFGRNLIEVEENAFLPRQPPLKPTKTFWLSETPPKGHETVGAYVRYAVSDSYGNDYTVYPLLGSVFEKDGMIYVPTDTVAPKCEAVAFNYYAPATAVNIKDKVTFGNREYGLESIKPYCAYHTGVVSVEIESENLAIGEFAFAECFENRSISVKVADIGDCAFVWNTAVQTVNVEADTIGEHAFSGLHALMDCAIKATHLGEGCFYDSTSEGAVLRVEASRIEDSAFAVCTGLHKADIKADIIGLYAFSNCSELRELSVEAEVVDGAAFYECFSLEKASVKAGVIWTSAFFSSFVADAEIDLQGTEIIGEYAFQNAGFKHIALPESITTIGTGAFSYNNNLESFRIPDSAVNVGIRLFVNCKSLKNVAFGSSMTVVPAGSLMYCDALETAEIPDGIKSIGEQAFSGCTSLRTITNRNVVPPVCVRDAFMGVSTDLCELYVPAESLEAYREAGGWKDFLSIKGLNGVGETMADTPASNEYIRVYDSKGSLHAEGPANTTICNLPSGLWIISNDRSTYKYLKH